MDTLTNDERRLIRIALLRFADHTSARELTSDNEDLRTAMRARLESIDALLAKMKGPVTVTHGDSDELRANTRLIAAAPELLAALRLALEALDADVENAPMNPVAAAAAQAWMRGKFGYAALAAIAKVAA